MFSGLIKRKIIILETFNLSSANAFNLVTSKKLSFGNGLNSHEMLLYYWNITKLIWSLLFTLNGIILPTTILLQSMVMDFSHKDVFSIKRSAFSVSGYSTFEVLSASDCPFFFSKSIEWKLLMRCDA